MAGKHQHATPLILSSTRPGGRITPLRQIALERAGSNGSRYDERWIQCLIHENPALLPIEELEPDLVPALPVCIELPTPAGYADNLFVTPRGGLVLAECKLWRNPEARRQVVAQVIDYARCFVEWTYSDLGGNIQLSGGRGPYAVLGGRSPKIGVLLDRADAWRAAIESYIRVLKASLATARDRDAASSGGPSA